MCIRDRYIIVVKGFIKLSIVIAVLGGIWFAWEQWKGNEAIQVDYQTEPLDKGDLMLSRIHIFLT